MGNFQISGGINKALESNNSDTSSRSIDFKINEKNNAEVESVDLNDLSNKSAQPEVKITVGKDLDEQASKNVSGKMTINGMPYAGAAAAFMQPSDEKIYKTVNIPEDIKQTGMSRNYTDYNEFYNKWANGSKQKKIAKMWDEQGRTSNNGIATLNGRYLVAMSPVFGQVGDNVNVKLSDGTIIPCTIADQKGADATSIYGHQLGKNGSDGVDIVEWEAVAKQEDIDLGNWRAKNAVAVYNLTRS